MTARVDVPADRRELRRRRARRFGTARPLGTSLGLATGVKAGLELLEPRMYSSAGGRRGDGGTDPGRVELSTRRPSSAARGAKADALAVLDDAMLFLHGGVDALQDK